MFISTDTHVHHREIKMSHRNGQSHTALVEGMSREDLPCSCGQFTQKNDVRMRPETDRVWQKRKRAERRVMAGFKHCNREVITHSELTLQMDELLECALPRLRVRKLHMHKTKMGEGGGTSYKMKSEKQPDTS